MKLWSSVLKLQWVQLKVGLQSDPPKVGNWTGFAKKIKWKKIATYYWVQSHTYTKILSSVLKVGLQLDPPPPPPPSKKLDWICKKKIHFFHSENQLEKKLATYYWVQSHTYTKIWWNYEVLCWSCSECSSRWDCSQTTPPPPPKVGNWTGFAKKINWKKNSYILLSTATHLY